jgi:hypothetical protein
MGSAYREFKSAFGGERWDSRLHSERLQGSYLRVQNVVASHYERPSIEPAPFGSEGEAEIWNDTLTRTRSLGLRPQVHFSGTVRARPNSRVTSRQIGQSMGNLVPHVELETAIGVHVLPDQRRQGAEVSCGEFALSTVGAPTPAAT